MGTVGLSFGSPTSGAGFNVSTTVAEIVGNLQNVETPWKNQLTSLESQDKAISNLGTLFSNLSNDISSLTDTTGILAQKEGSSSDTSVLELTAATSAAAAGTYTVVVKSLATTANGYLNPITDSSDALTGSITINGTEVDVPDSSTGEDNLSGLVSAINSADLGVTASVSTDSSGSRLSLVSNTSGAGGSLSVTSAIYDGSTELKYNSNLATGANASLSVNGATYSVASNTVNGLIQGVTFDLLSDSPDTDVQVVIANDNTDVESTVNQFVSDYNSLISAINTQEGNTSSGTAEPLFGSPTLTLLQDQLLNGLNTGNPSGYLDAVQTEGTTLSGSMTIAVGSGAAETVVIGAAPSAANGGPAANTIYTGSGSDYNTLAGLAAAINASSSTTLSYADTGYTSGDTDYDTGTVGEVANSGDSLSGSLSITVGSGTANTVTMAEVDSAEKGTTLSDLVSYINSNSKTLGVTASPVTKTDGTSSLSLQSTTTGTSGALTVTSGLADGIKVSAAVSTSDGESTLSLSSGTDGPSGALSVTSAIKASSPTPLTFADSSYTSTTADSGTLGSAAVSTDTLSGSVTVQVGSGAAQTIDMSTVESDPSIGGATLGDLQQYISDNSSTLGFTASIVNKGDGSQSLSLTSNTVGSTGALTVTSNLYDTTSPTKSALAYTSSSDINSLTDLGISVNNDGSLTFDASSLDSVLNTDYSSVVGFFQNANSWGQTFSNMLTNAGTSSSKGILAEASSSNSSMESTLNEKISNENSLISADQSSLTTELNSANETLQEIPTELSEINELYSAITGYNESSNS